MFYLLQIASVMQGQSTDTSLQFVQLDTIYDNNWLWLPVVGNPEGIQIVIIEKEDKSYKLTLENI